MSAVQRKFDESLAAEAREGVHDFRLKIEKHFGPPLDPDIFEAGMRSYAELLAEKVREEDRAAVRAFVMKECASELRRRFQV